MSLRKRPRIFASLLLSLMLASCGLDLWRPGERPASWTGSAGSGPGSGDPYPAVLERLVYDRIAEYRGAIVTYARAVDVDPAVVIAIVYAEKVQYELDKLRAAKERMVDSLAFARLLRKSLVTWASLSVGFTHIKPEFAARTKTLADRVQGLAGILGIGEVAPEGYIDRPETAVKITCVALAVLQAQWRADPGGMDISREPAILATLYNLGYDKSRPNRHPVPGGSVMPVVINGVNIPGLTFGDRVRRLCEESRLLRELVDGVPTAR